MRDSTYDFRCYDFETNDEDWYQTGPFDSIVTTTYPIKIIENEFLRLKLLPDYGGRIISCYNKLTKHEELYQANPATCYTGPEKRTFFYAHLVVPGGIYPTFPEPEHGKAWNQKWDLTVVTNTSELAVVEMSYLDDKYKFVDKRWKHGITYIRCTARITLAKGKSSFTMNIKLENTKDQEQGYEYWTCVTLTPGSKTDTTISPLNTVMVAPIDRAQYKSNWWRWMGSADEKRSTDPGVPWLRGSVHTFKNLKHFKNWKEEGIAYGYPYFQKNHWGAINLNNREGMLRIADNKTYTPGLKIWTWGKESINADLTDPKDCKRAHMEMWAGHSREFFLSKKMSANQTIQWDEHFYPIVGIQRVDTANTHGALELGYEHGSVNNERTAFFKAIISTIYPNTQHAIDFKAVSTSNREYSLFKGNKTFSGKEAIVVSVDQKVKQIPRGEYTLYLTVKDSKGTQLLSFQKKVTVTFNLTPITTPSMQSYVDITNLLSIKQIGERIIFTKRVNTPIDVTLYSLAGRKVLEKENISHTFQFVTSSSQCFILEISNNGSSYTQFLRPLFK